jgi:hypothetical protein
MTEALERGNRRAEIDENFVTFFRLTGKVRRTKRGVWKYQAENIKRARHLARRWIMDGKLGTAVLAR